MTAMKPSKEMLLKTVIGKQSADRVFWSEAKKKAAAKKIDPEAAFKKAKGKLGAELDKLRDIVEGGKKFIKAFPQGLDPEGKKVVNTQAQKCRTIINEYQKICVAESKKAGLTPTQKDAWEDLHAALHMREIGIDNTIRPVLK
jgi:hypothetical protein